MAGWSKQRRQRRRDWAWSPLLGIILGIPLLVIVVALWKDVWHLDCRLFSLSGKPTCEPTELITVAAASLGSVGVFILVWWVISELTGLRRLFEAPWLGIGEDVENASAVESVLRAAMFILALWLCIAMIFPFIMALRDRTNAVVTPNKPIEPTLLPGDEPPPTPSDPILVQLKHANATLQDIKELLAQQSRHLDSLTAINKKLADWDPKAGSSLDRNVELIRETTGQIDQNAQRILERIGKQSGKAAGRPNIRVSIFNDSYDNVPEQCPDLTPSLASPAGPDNQAPPLDGGDHRRFRTVAVQPIFFDRGSPALSDWAKQELSWFVDEANVAGGRFVVFGSTDPQGTLAQNAQLAEERARAIAKYIQDEKDPRKVISIKWATEGGAPKSEPYKRVTTIRMLQPCP